MSGQGHKDKKKIILGLTGSFGSGKSTVAKILKSFGARIIDADRIAHRVIQPPSKVYQKIIHTFGKDILKQNRTIDRNKLAKIVFKDKAILKRLNQIVHPKVIKTIKNQIKTTKKKVVVLDAPLLLEAGLGNLVDKLIVVKIKRKKQVGRLEKKTSLNKKEILSRIKAQILLSHKVRLADFVIDNNGTFKNTKRQVRLFWRNLVHPNKH
jgi:dephospho-CoA kinase